MLALLFASLHNLNTSMARLPNLALTISSTQGITFDTISTTRSEASCTILLNPRLHIDSLKTTLKFLPEHV